MWIARDKNGILWLFNTKPIRGLHYDTETDSYTDEYDNWVVDNTEGIEDYNDMYDIIQLPSSLFPNLKWEDDPIEIDLVPKILNSCQEKLAKAADDYFDYVSHAQDICPYSKEQEQNYYNDLCYRWQDWNEIKHDPKDTWDLNFNDYVSN